MKDQTQIQPDTKTFTLSDQSIAGVMQLLTVALETFTDITDLMRMVKFEERDGGQLFITNASARGVEKYCQDIVDRAKAAQAAQAQVPTLETANDVARFPTKGV